jgi:mono/diheme cytochrome c family protein
VIRQRLFISICLPLRLCAQIASRKTGKEDSPMAHVMSKRQPGSLPGDRKGLLLLERSLLVGMLFLLADPPQAAAQQAGDFFQQNCMNCHTIGGGRLTGPDLKDVEQRRDRGSLIEFLLDPPAMVARGDPYVLKLQQEARGVVMPKLAGMDRARVEALLDLIKTESANPKSRFKGVAANDQPFTTDDIAMGKALFLGNQKLVNGAPPCVSCHTVSGLTGLGGGRLGPDLTKVYERLQGRKTLSAWLFAPATTTMQPVFKNNPLTPEEILPLVAFFESTAQSGVQANSVGLVYFFFLALGGTCLGLVFFETAWKNRMRTVRQAIVQKSRRGTP